MPNKFKLAKFIWANSNWWVSHHSEPGAAQRAPPSNTSSSIYRQENRWCTEKAWLITISSQHSLAGPGEIKPLPWEGRVSAVGSCYDQLRHGLLVLSVSSSTMMQFVCMLGKVAVRYLPKHKAHGQLGTNLVEFHATLCHLHHGHVHFKRESTIHDIGYLSVLFVPFMFSLLKPQWDHSSVMDSCI